MPRCRLAGSNALLAAPTQFTEGTATGGPAEKRLRKCSRLPATCSSSMESRWPLTSLPLQHPADELYALQKEKLRCPPVQDQQQQGGLLQGAGEMQAESSPQLQHPVKGEGLQGGGALQAEESQQPQHTPPRSRGSAGSQELLGVSRPVMSSPFLQGPAPDFAQQPPAQPTSTPASGALRPCRSHCCGCAAAVQS